MKIQKINYRDQNAPKLFSDSLKDHGFAVLTHHSIDTDLLKRVYSDWATFFASPSKHEYRFDPVTQSGYFPFQSENAKDSPVKDLKEFFHIYPNTQLPQMIQTSTLTLKNQLIELASELLQWLQATTILEIKNQFSMPLPKMIQNSDQTLFRILHYPPLPSTLDPGAVRAAAHEDINLITLLPAATHPGLEVLDTSGKWHEVPCDPGNMIINAGDMLELASQGYYPSTTHRVVNPKGEAAHLPRYSMPLFLHPRGEVLLSRTKTAKTYLQERLREIGLK